MPRAIGTLPRGGAPPDVSRSPGAGCRASAGCRRCWLPGPRQAVERQQASGRQQTDERQPAGERQQADERQPASGRQQTDERQPADERQRGARCWCAIGCQRDAGYRMLSVAGGRDRSCEEMGCSRQNMRVIRVHCLVVGSFAVLSEIATRENDGGLR